LRSLAGQQSRALRISEAADKAEYAALAYTALHQFQVDHLMIVDVEVDEEDVRLLRVGQSAAVKLESFPTRTFRGPVLVVSPQGQPSGDKRIFFARVEIANPNGLLRAGMQGRGKVSAGWHPAGYVIFRRMAMWAWSTAWSWFGF